MRPFYFARNTSFTAVDLAGMTRESPEVVARAFAEHDRADILHSGVFTDSPADTCLPRLGDFAGSTHFFALREKDREGFYRMEQKEFKYPSVPALIVSSCYW